MIIVKRGESKIEGRRLDVIYELFTLLLHFAKEEPTILTAVLTALSDEITHANVESDTEIGARLYSMLKEFKKIAEI